LRTSAREILAAPIVLLLPALLLLAVSPAPAVETEVQDVADPQEAEAELLVRPSRSFIFLPIVVANPTIGTGGGAAAMLLYAAGDEAPSSFTALTGLYTDSDSWVAGLGQRTFLSHDSYRLNAAAGYFRLNVDFYGVGDEAGDEGLSIPITQRGIAALPEFLARMGESYYAGIKYRVIRAKTTINLTEIDLGYPIIPEAELDVTSSGLGLTAQIDTRDNQLNASQGTSFEVDLFIMWEKLGSDFNYQVFQLAYNEYVDATSSSVLAFRLFGRFAYGDTPFWDLSMIGVGSDIRGYVGGRYRDRALLAAQLEYRWQFYKRWGLVVFGGVGQVGANLGDYRLENLLPSFGLGMRWMASVGNRVNVGVDYARGKDSDAFYFRIGEAF
jgi:outer membrane protein assembly factor BamA